MEHLWQIVVLMALVTYIPRMLPVVLLRDIKLPPFINTFLQYVPFAVLGALIFPGVLTSTGNTQTAIAGMVVSVILAALRINIMLVVFGGILGVFLWGLLI